MHTWPDSVPGVTALNDAEFWQLVDEVHVASGGDMTRKCALLAQRLIGLDDLAIAAYCQHFDAAMERAYSHPLWAAAYTIGGGCSDDRFMDFRGTLISHGRAVYEGALADPESLADLSIETGDLLFYEGYQYIGGRIAEQRLGEMPPRAVAVQDEPTGEAWDEEDLPALYPRLSARFQTDDNTATDPTAAPHQKPAQRKPWWKLW